MPSSLHIDFGELYSSVEALLSRVNRSGACLLYGTCHPEIDTLALEHGATRADAQNCIELLLGKERFQAELARGAFFLLNDWCRRWDELMALAFGTSHSAIREIFHSSHRYFLALRTECSPDFTVAAEEISTSLALPLRWADVDLHHLESELGRLLRTVAPEMSCE